MKERINPAWIKVLFGYDQKSGVLVWSVPSGRYGRIKPGTMAGSVHTDQDGYQARLVTIEGRQYRSSHIIWAWMTGEWPKLTVDHKNLDSLDDKWENLREANSSEQKQNNRKRKDNQTGFKCVVSDKERNQYRWKVVVKGKRISSGRRWATAKEAHDDYCSRLEGFHGEFANDGAA